MAARKGLVRMKESGIVWWEFGYRAKNSMRSGNTKGREVIECHCLGRRASDQLIGSVAPCRRMPNQLIGTGAAWARGIDQMIEEKKESPAGGRGFFCG